MDDVITATITLGIDAVEVSAETLAVLQAYVKRKEGHDGGLSSETRGVVGE